MESIVPSTKSRMRPGAADRGQRAGRRSMPRARTTRRPVERRSASMVGLRPWLAAAMLGLMSALSAAAADEVTLGSAAGRSGRYFGAALDPGALDERAYRDLAAAELTSVTPENAMKWEEVEPRRGAFHWDAADALVAFAKA